MSLSYISTDAIAQNVAHIKQRIDRACERSGRDPADVTLIAVTKTQPVEAVRAAFQCGISHMGENRVQEAQAKIPLLPQQIHWHLIGSLQTNKVKPALNMFTYIHSVDRPRLVEALRKQKIDTPPEVLMQVNVAEESSKHGVSMSDAVELARLISAAGLRMVGLMTVAPYVTDPEEVRPVFRRLRELFMRLQDIDLPGAQLRHLSMGMSGDFEVAIEEGATMVRVGTAIFGERK
ncbi:MAG TPA: YggS family pyridoxal phosphate-dependent enzyme [Firmicutes bacterium]|jgi:pyridoxal phosphate enzyme (YggS family)|nr:YggS family pyridoxal phosphate-dependent enzyme [Bacillota bacterium]